ncbi:MAG: non-heme iron oxygenase ferredoxin subunit [Candidatus Dormibacteria bacterium]
MTRVAAVDDIPVGEARRFKIDGQEIAVVNAGTHFYAVNDICTHEYFHLTDGEVDLEELTIECPKHGSAFSLTTGQPRSFPAILPLATYGVRVEDGQVLVDVIGVTAEGAASA